MRAKFFQEDLDELLTVQAEILETAGRLVKKGGKLIYGTCSVLMEENEDQIAKFIEKFPEFSVENLELAGCEDLICNGFLRLSPARSATDGFFAASLRKNGD
jgi:16S rRNA (cytosine967-C5)-methyltransferase